MSLRGGTTTTTVSLLLSGRVVPRWSRCWWDRSWDARSIGRPYETMPRVHVLIDRTSDFSFLSDHALVAGAVAVALLFANRRWGIVAGVAAGLMALARVYVGAHYPGDVVAGLVFGAVVAIAGGLLLVPVLNRVVDRLVRTPLRPLLSARRPAPALIDVRDV